MSGPDQGNERSAMFDRRSFLLIGGALTLSPAARAFEATPPVPPTALPRAWTRAEVVALWPGPPPGEENFVHQVLPPQWPSMFVRNIATPALHVFRPVKSNDLGLLIIPGGAYQFISILNEGVDVAARLNALGYTVFVLTHRLPGEGWKDRANVPLQDAQRALRLIRARAKAFRIDAQTLAVIGFSAGGHLAGTLATGHAEKVYSPIDSADELSARPFAAGLIYPVITMRTPLTHQLSRDLLLGADPSEDLLTARSVELHVNAETPPVFLAHAMDDDAVPVDNSLHLLAAMQAEKRPVEAHFFQEGGHAFGIGMPGTPSSQWIRLFAGWLDRLRVSIRTTPIPP